MHKQYDVHISQGWHFRVKCTLVYRSALSLLGKLIEVRTTEEPFPPVSLPSIPNIIELMQLEDSINSVLQKETSIVTKQKWKIAKTCSEMQVRGTDHREFICNPDYPLPPEIVFSLFKASILHKNAIFCPKYNKDNEKSVWSVSIEDVFLFRAIFE